MEYVARHAGIEGQAAKGLLEHVLTLFAASLTRSEAERLADELPVPASQWVTNAKHGEMFEPNELYHRMQDRFGVKMGMAMEQAQVALGAMARELRPETRQWLEQRMGEPWKPLFETRRPPPSTPTRPQSRVHAAAEEHRTLAEGRAGSTRPLSESAPSRTQPDSVAEDNPYGDRKVSSSHDVHAEPISSSNPRSKHPLSEDDSTG